MGEKKGPLNIRQELRQKGIKDSFIEQSMDEYSSEKQIEHAIQLGDKIARQNNNLSETFLKQKIEQFLLTKGFPFNIISIAIDEIDYEKDDDDEWNALQIQGEKVHRRYKNFTGFEYKQKMKQALYRKGFAIELIERYLNDNE